MFCELYKAAPVCCAVLTAFVLCCPARVQAAHSGVLAPGAACDAAGRVAEMAAHIPRGLLRAIGQVESGRPDAASGAVLPWPWTLNLSGQGRFYASQDEALMALRQAVAEGVRSIDVGCFQVSLLYHPDAFPSLAAALDPVANANYAAEFLASLQQRTGNWPTAVAWYHSAEATRGEPYRAAVLARWDRREGSAETIQSDPFVVHIGGAIARMLPVVWTPLQPSSVVTVRPQPGMRPFRLPRVMTPMLARQF
jgi:hypothetical protein